MTLQTLLDWIAEDRSPEVQWLRANCEPCKRYVVDNSGRHELDAWTLREVPSSLEVTIIPRDTTVRAYCSNGTATVASVDIPHGGKWRNALCEAIFWVKGFRDGWESAPISDDG